MSEAELTNLPNIGEKLAARLTAVGIETRHALDETGSARAYAMLCAEQGARLPLCYYLYSLEAALRGKNWRTLTDDEKRGLRERVFAEVESEDGDT